MGSEWWKNLPKVTQLVERKFQAWSSWLQRSHKIFILQSEGSEWGGSKEALSCLLFLSVTNFQRQRADAQCVDLNKKCTLSHSFAVGRAGLSLRKSINRQSLSSYQCSPPGLWTVLSPWQQCPLTTIQVSPWPPLRYCFSKEILIL